MLTGGAAVAQQAACHDRRRCHSHHARHHQRGLPARGGVVGAAARHIRLGLDRKDVGLAGRVVLSEAQGLRHRGRQGMQSQSGQQGAARAMEQGAPWARDAGHPAGDS